MINANRRMNNANRRMNNTNRRTNNANRRTNNAGDEWRPRQAANVPCHAHSTPLVCFLLFFTVTLPT
jgi:hypothetical protein